MDAEFRLLVEAVKDCCDKILAGNDLGHLWTTTLNAHCYVIANDFTVFGTPRPLAAPPDNAGRTKEGSENG